MLCHLLAWRELRTPRPELTYWRTASGEEVDFVIEAERRLLPIEVKSTMRPTPRDARGLVAFLEEYPRVASFGVVAHPGDECRLLGQNVIAVPLAGLL